MKPESVFPGSGIVKAVANGTRDPVGIRHGFHPLDYALFATLLLISLAVGIYYAVRGQKNTNEYLRASRSMSVIPISLSIYMSHMSAILVLGQSAEMYIWGAQNWLQVVGMAMGFVFTAAVLVPFFYPLNLTSVFEVGARR